MAPEIILTQPAVVWAFYPESNQRTLEEIDFLFAGDTPWNWVAESNFARLKQENPEIAHDLHHGVHRDVEELASDDKATTVSVAASVSDK